MLLKVTWQIGQLKANLSCIPSVQSERLTNNFVYIFCYILLTFQTIPYTNNAGRLVKDNDTLVFGFTFDITQHQKKKYIEIFNHLIICWFVVSNQTHFL